MSKSTMIGFVAGLGAATILMGIVVWARTVVDHEVERSARIAVDQQAKIAARNVANEGVRDAAKQIADRLITQSDLQDKSVPPSVDVTKIETVTLVDRDAYSITLPAGAKLDPMPDEPGMDHVMEASLPGHAQVNIVVIDDKERAKAICENSADTIHRKIDGGEAFVPSALGSTFASDVKAFCGRERDIKTAYEVGDVQGKQKACLFIIGYQVTDKPVAPATVKQALATFKMKQ